MFFYQKKRVTTSYPIVGSFILTKHIFFRRFSIKSLSYIGHHKNIFRDLKKILKKGVVTPSHQKSSAQKIYNELYLKLHDQWSPLLEEEICHCFGISSSIIDEAIVLGAHSVQEVKKSTLAGQRCLGCEKGINSLITRRISENL